jgi:methionyl aminopeptidase
MENYDDWRKAGKMAATALDYGKGLMKKDASVLDICNKVEEKIKELGGNLAFPAQISVNETAAHFCPDTTDIILTDQVASLDIGVHINGAIGDTAVSVDLSEKNSEIVKASEEALKEAIKIVQIGTALGDIGKIIEDTITSYGFNPVRNLSGHGLERYNIHSYPTIPNFNTKEKTKLAKGQIIAIEPFATSGSGLIHEEGTATLFVLMNKKSVRTPFVRDILAFIEKYENLPFTKRWLSAKFGEPKVNFALNQFRQLGMLKEYPPLVERSNSLVSQAEETLLIEDKVEILTNSSSLV